MLDRQSNISRSGAEGAAEPVTTRPAAAANCPEMQIDTPFARRAREQEALFRFTDRLYRTTSISDTYDAALDAITETLQCPSASILRFDQSGVMRFVAWHNLSETYRKAVDGHSPWKLGDRDPEPIFISDVDHADLPDDLRATIKAEGIRALAFMPITAAGRTIGKFMAYYSAPRTFDRHLTDLAVAVSRQLGFSLERAEIEMRRLLTAEALRQSEQRLRAVFNSPTVGVAILTPEGTFIEVNQTFSELTGHGVDELREVSLLDLTHPDDRPAMRVLLDDMLEGNRSDFVIEKRYLRKDGSVIWVQNSASLTHDEAGRPLHLVKLIQDISGRKAAEKRQRLLIDEINHRVKNTLATVLSFAAQSLRGATSLAAGRATFEARLIALSKSHDVLTREHWEGADVIEVVNGAIAPYRGAGDTSRFLIQGPSLRLRPKAVLALSLAFHELATNAVKYGALSSDSGKVSISWRVDPQTERFELLWQESGGPAVQPPRRRGFGSRLIEHGLAHDLAGEVRLEFGDLGVTCEISAPLHEIAGSD
jgi:PAS domain S-box-containing protein